MRAIAQRLGTILLALVFVAVAAAALLGTLRPLDNGLRDLRFAAQTRAPPRAWCSSTSTPRASKASACAMAAHIHAALLDKLMALGADDVVFDVDFSVNSTPAEDAAFGAALERAGGYAHLAAFQQQRTGDGPPSSTC